MGENSNIEWTHHTFNPWRGCTKVSAGCAHCYAETLSKRNPKALGVWGDQGTRVVASEAYWRQPLKWNAEAAAAGERRRVFCASLADVFEDRPELIEPRGRLFRLIKATPHLDWLLLTKRPENIFRLSCPGETLKRHNLWLGTSVENQSAADARIPLLVDCRDMAQVLFLSIEPLLGAINLSKFLIYSTPHGGGEYVNSYRSLLHWVIVGGESGHGARPMHPDWAHGIREQCQAAGVPFFFKQWGNFVAPNQMTEKEFDNFDAVENAAGNPNLDTPFGVGKKRAGRLLDGREWNEMPAVAAGVAACS